MQSIIIIINIIASAAKLSGRQVFFFCLLRRRLQLHENLFWSPPSLVCILKAQFIQLFPSKLHKISLNVKWWVWMQINSFFLFMHFKVAILFGAAVILITWLPWWSTWMNTKQTKEDETLTTKQSSIFLVKKCGSIN